jgi:hypothetical protein
MLDKQQKDLEKNRKHLTNRISNLENRIKPTVISAEQVVAELTSINKQLADVVTNPTWEKAVSFQEFIEGLEESNEFWTSTLPQMLEAYHVRIEVDAMTADKVALCSIQLDGTTITESVAIA